MKKLASPRAADRIDSDLYSCVQFNVAHVNKADGNVAHLSVAHVDVARRASERDTI